MKKFNLKLKIEKKLQKTEKILANICNKTLFFITCQILEFNINKNISILAF